MVLKITSAFSAKLQISAPSGLGKAETASAVCRTASTAAKNTVSAAGRTTSATGRTVQRPTTKPRQQAAQFTDLPQSSGNRAHSFSDLPQSPGNRAHSLRNRIKTHSLQSAEKALTTVLHLQCDLQPRSQRNNCTSYQTQQVKSVLFVLLPDPFDLRTF